MKVSFLGLVFLIFLTLKLTNYIDWSWIWVTAPLWGGLVFVVMIAGLVLLIDLYLNYTQEKIKRLKK